MRNSVVYKIVISIVFLAVLSPLSSALAPIINTPTPSNNSNNHPTSLTLSWIGSDPDGDVVTYTVYRIDSNDQIQICSGTSTSCKISGLSTITRYNWIVVAQDTNGETTYGPNWFFSTGTIDTQPEIDERIIVLETTVQQQNVKIDTLRSEMNSISGILNSLKEFTHKIYNALSHKMQKEIGPWPF